MINVLIVEDDPMARQLLEIYINASEKYNHIQSVESAALAEFCCRTNKVDVILMDVCTAMNASGLDAAEKSKRAFPTLRLSSSPASPSAALSKERTKWALTAFGTRAPKQSKSCPFWIGQWREKQFSPNPPRPLNWEIPSAKTLQTVSLRFFGNWSQVSRTPLLRKNCLCL